jgi:putative nucleotidyltransferase with HDIG domain
MSNRSRYFGISPLLIHPDSAGRFRVYLKRGEDAYLLYCSEDDAFTEQKLQRLHQTGVEEIFIPHEDAKAYQDYARDNLGSILADTKIPPRLRSQMFYRTSSGLVEEAFSRRLPHEIPQTYMDQVHKLVEDCLTFLSGDTNLAEVAKFMSHDYETYTHCVNVFVLVIAILKDHPNYSDEDMKQIGVGAVLHDIGKTQIPREIIRKPGKLNEEEFRAIKRHPTLGNALCMRLELPPKVANIVLYHHEKLDGSGYPAGIDMANLPTYIRAVTVADIYDALTSKRSYAEAMQPFEALQLMKDEFWGKIDGELFTRLIQIIGGSDV